MPAPVFRHQGEYYFGLTPDELWNRMEDVDQFERWWPWLTEFRLDGNGLAEGSILQGVVTPSLPYRMRLRIELGRCDRPHAVDATVAGDLTGDARLRIRPEGEGSTVAVAWTIEVRQPVMRVAARVGRPVLQWGHDRVVETTVARFRRRIENPWS
jgi:carbon monoxide dehydrogenase subunit G